MGAEKSWLMGICGLGLIGVFQLTYSPVTVTVTEKTSKEIVLHKGDVLRVKLENCHAEDRCWSLSAYPNEFLAVSNEQQEKQRARRNKEGLHIQDEKTFDVVFLTATAKGKGNITLKYKPLPKAENNMEKMFEVSVHVK